MLVRLNERVTRRDKELWIKGVSRDKKKENCPNNRMKVKVKVKVGDRKKIIRGKKNECRKKIGDL